MTRSTSLRRHALAIALALGGAVGWSMPAAAQSDPAPADSVPPADSNVLRLSDEQRDEIFAENTEDRAAAARGELTSGERAERHIHGEIGAMIGSNGTRGAYGMADIPLGDNAQATVAVESSRFGYGTRRR